VWGDGLVQGPDLGVTADSDGVIGPTKKAVNLSVKDVVKEGDEPEEVDEAGLLSPGSRAKKRRLGKRALALRSWADRYALWKVECTDPKEMPVVQAFVRGYLTKTDYGTLGSLVVFCFLVFIMGVIIGAEVSPSWIGHAIWTGTFIVILTIWPIIKYFQTYTITLGMTVSMGVGMFLFTITCFSFFGDTLRGSTTVPESLWVFTVWILYPSILLLGSAAYMWRDDGYFVNKKVVYAVGVALIPVLFFVIIVFGLGDSLAGGVVLLITMFVLATVGALHVWAINDFFLPHSYMVLCDGLLFFMAGLFVFIGMVSSVNIFWCFSIAVFFVVIRQLGLALAHLVNRNPESPLFFSPFLFPMFSYQPDTFNIVSENRLGVLVGSSILLVLVWGLLAVAFVHNLAVGVGITSLVLIGTVLLLAFLVSYTPLRLGQASQFADEWVLKQAGEHVHNVFRQRRQAFNILCDEFVQRDVREREMLMKADRMGAKQMLKAELEAEAAAAGSLVKRTTAVQLAETIIKLEWELTKAFPWETRAPPAVPTPAPGAEGADAEAAASAESGVVLGGQLMHGTGASAPVVTPGGPDDPVPGMAFGDSTTPGGPPARVRSKASVRARLLWSKTLVHGRALWRFTERHVRAFMEWDVEGPKTVYSPVQRHDAPYTLWDVCEDMWYTGDGPLGWMTGRGWFYKGLLRYRKWRKDRANKKKYEAELLKEGDMEEGEGLTAEGGAGETKGADDGSEGKATPRSPGSDASAKSPKSPASPTSPGSPGSPSSDLGDTLNETAVSTAPKVPGLAVLDEVTTGAPYLGERRDRFGVLIDCVDIRNMYRELLQAYDDLAREYYEENRVIVHLQLLVMMACEARLRSEAVLFQKFLREYRYKLMVNDVQPPDNVFHTHSYATVDVKLVATWLLRLSPEKRERFKSLKDRFSEEVEAQYQLRLQADQEAAAASYQHLMSLRPHEHYMWQKRWQECQKRRIARKKAGTDDPNIPEDELNAQEVIRVRVSCACSTRVPAG
jgi:hypothetical protein